MLKYGSQSPPLAILDVGPTSWLPALSTILQWHRGIDADLALRVPVGDDEEIQPDRHVRIRARRHRRRHGASHRYEEKERQDAHSNGHLIYHMTPTPDELGAMLG
jgi:hypothetical protein